MYEQLERNRHKNNAIIFLIQIALIYNTSNSLSNFFDSNFL